MSRSTCTQTPKVLLWQISIASWANTATTLCDHSPPTTAPPLRVWSCSYCRCVRLSSSANSSDQLQLLSRRWHNSPPVTMSSPTPLSYMKQIILAFSHSWTENIKSATLLLIFFFFLATSFEFFAAGFSSWTDTRGRLSSCFSLRRYLAAPLPPVSDEGMV